MQDNQINIQRYEEDEIDLRRLFRTLMKNKIKIVVITLVVTIGAIVYAYSLPKVYQAKAIIKIGEYKLNSNSNSNSNSNVIIDNASELTKELEVLYIDLFKNEKDRDAKIERISLLKKQKNLFEIVAIGNSNETALYEIKTVVDFVQNRHKKALEDIKALYKAKTKQYEDKLVLLNTKTLPSLISKIQRYKENIKIYEDNFINVQKNLKKIKDTNPTLAALQINEQKYLAGIIMQLRDSLGAVENKKNDIEMIEISRIQEEINTLKSLMKPHNYKNTEVIGKIMTNDHPIKPKKKLIVVVAFITGLILSIFLAFFMEFIKGYREEEATETK